MNSSSLETLAHKWLDAFNRKDLEALLNLYDRDAQHYSPKLKLRKPETNGLINGREQLRAWWQDAFDRLPSLYYKCTNLIAANNQVFIEYIRQVEGEDDLPVGEVLQTRNDLIIFSRVYHG